jgi:hypothetical protein
MGTSRKKEIGVGVRKIKKKEIGVSRKKKRVFTTFA